MSRLLVVTTLVVVRRTDISSVRSNDFSRFLSTISADFDPPFYCKY